MSGPVDGAPPPSLGGPVERRGHGLFRRRHHDEDDAAAWCPQCGGEFRAGATWCDDCGVPLSTEAPVAVEDDGEARADAERHDIVEWDLSDWDQEQLRAIEDQLGIARIPHEWIDHHLHAPGIHEDAVDNMVDAIDGLDEVADDVQYEFVNWTPQQREQLVDRLLELGIACIWDGNLLSIGEADEAAVDAEVLAIDPSFPVTDAGRAAEGRRSAGRSSAQRRGAPDGPGLGDPAPAPLTLCCGRWRTAAVHQRPEPRGLSPR